MAVVNTGDDTVMHGLHISPDLDTVTYTLAGLINPETGWGLTGETWAAMEELRAYSGGPARLVQPGRPRSRAPTCTGPPGWRKAPR